MSWASHDVEGWEEVEKDAVIRYLDQVWEMMWGTDSYNEVADDFLPKMVELLFEEAPGVFANLLLSKALEWLGVSEADYLERKHGRLGM